MHLLRRDGQFGGAALSVCGIVIKTNENFSVISFITRKTLGQIILAQQESLFDRFFWRNTTIPQLVVIEGELQLQRVAEKCENSKSLVGKASRIALVQIRPVDMKVTHENLIVSERGEIYGVLTEPVVHCGSVLVTPTLGLSLIKTNQWLRASTADVPPHFGI